MVPKASFVDHFTEDNFDEYLDLCTRKSMEAPTPLPDPKVIPAVKDPVDTEIVQSAN